MELLRHLIEDDINAITTFGNFDDAATDVKPVAQFVAGHFDKWHGDTRQWWPRALWHR